MLFQFDGRKVDNIIGGKGHKEGDEGSGYYFGKLVFDAFNNKRLTKEQESIFIRLIDVDEVQTSIGADSEKFILANISAKLCSHQTEFSDFHILNIEAFYEVHKSGIQSGELYLVGSYAFYNQDVIMKVLNDFRIEVKGIVQKPIMRLVEQTVSFID